MNVNVIPLALLLRTRFRDETSASFRKHGVHLGFTTLACASMNRGGRRVVHDRHAANEACFRERYKTDEMENGRVTRCGGLSMGKDERIGLIQLRADPVTGKPQWRTGPERPQAGRVKLLSNSEHVRQVISCRLMALQAEHALGRFVRNLLAKRFNQILDAVIVDPVVGIQRLLDQLITRRSSSFLGP